MATKLKTNLPRKLFHWQLFTGILMKCGVVSTEALLYLIELLQLPADLFVRLAANALGQ